MKVLLIDHEDSFVHNIEQALRVEGANVDCLRATVRVATAVRTDPDAIVLSPGPGHPSDRRITGLARVLLNRWDQERPFLGVCLGHQVVADHYGGEVVHAPAPVHGEATDVVHDGRGIFRGVRSPFVAARYHSLAVRRSSLPRTLEISAIGSEGLIMGLRHRSRPVESVQFHPESYLTLEGPQLLRNFLAEVRR